MQRETIWKAAAYKLYSFMTFRERGGCFEASSFLALRAEALMAFIFASLPKTSSEPGSDPGFAGSWGNDQSSLPSDFALEITLPIIKT